jgi:hypothetical protein
MSAAYCTDADLLISSNLPMPTGMHKSKYVQDAADEINLRLANRYRVPVVFTAEQQQLYAATLLFLKQLNVHIATGRLIMALDARGENDTLHAYGASLVSGALELIQDILKGDISLEGAVSLNDLENVDHGSTRPALANLDPFSQVEAFYQVASAPVVYTNPFLITEGY